MSEPPPKKETLEERLEEIQNEKKKETLEEQEERFDDEWDYVYGGEMERVHRLVMAGGGSHWWHYLVNFDKEGEQQYVQIENKDGVRGVEGTLYVLHTDDGCEYVRLCLEDPYENLPDFLKKDEVACHEMVLSDIIN